MTETYIFQSGRQIDAAKIIEFWQNNDVSLSATDTPEALRETCQINPELFLVALERHSHAIAGTVWGNFDGRRGFAVHLGVRRDLRGRGLGSALMAKLEQRFCDLGVFRIHLFVEKKNLAVVEYYEKRGFEIRDDLVLLSKTFA